MPKTKPNSELTYIRADVYTRLDLNYENGGLDFLSTLYEDIDGEEYYMIEPLGKDKDLYMVISYGEGGELDIMLKTDYEKMVNNA